MAISKIVLNGTTQMDITDTTAQSEDVAQGVYFYGADGVKREGSMAEGGTSTTSDKVVHFIDYDGTALYDYSKDEWTNITSLPAVPSHQGLVSQGWNWTKESIDTQLTKYPEGDIYIGALYITDTGYTRIYVHIEENCKTPMIGIHLYGNLDVDWGDGSEHTVLTSNSYDPIRWTPTHTYDDVGDYVITLMFYGGGSDGGGSIGLNGETASTIFRYSTDIDDDLNARYLACVTKIEFGQKININSYAFNKCTRLETVSMPENLWWYGDNVFGSCYSLKGIVLPVHGKTIGSSFASGGYSLKAISIPNDVNKIGTGAFSNCNFESITIPHGVTKINMSTFNYARLLKRITFPDGITTIENYGIANCNMLKHIYLKSLTPPVTKTNGSNLHLNPPDLIVHVPAESLEAYKTSSYWQYLADKIVGE